MVKTGIDFNYYEPIIPDEATEIEAELMRRYTKIQHTVCRDIPDAHNAYLVVNQQSFHVNGIVAYDTAVEASWSCWMLAKAIKTIIKENCDGENEN